MLSTREPRFINNTKPKQDHGITSLQTSNAQHRQKTTPHTNKETYQTNGTIFAIFSEFLPEKDKDIPRPTSTFTSPARSVIRKK